MDFKKPERPVEDLDRRFEGTDGVMPQPHPTPVVAKKGMSGVAKVIVILLTLLLMATAGYGAYAYMTEQQLRSDLSKAQTELSSLKEGKDSLVERARAAEEAERIRNDMSDEAQKTRVSLAASEYYCLIKDFGCDKVSATTTKFQAYKLSTNPVSEQRGFAIVTATPTTNEAAIKIYLTSSNGADWVVVYDGQNVPSEEVADRFELPESFR